jgi:hypothetical protein
MLLLVAFLGLFFVASPALSVPAWSRRCGAPFSLRHTYPGLQLNNQGSEFRGRGHRAKEGESTAFQEPDFHLHAGGALSGTFSAYVDANINNNLENAYRSCVPFARWAGVSPEIEGRTDRVQKGTLGFSIRALETDVKGRGVVAEPSYRRELGIYPNAILIKRLWAF